MEEKDNTNDNDKVQSLREMIYSMEKTLQGAKTMLLHIEGKKKVGRRKKVEGEAEDGRVVEGTFDGQIMMGNDGKQYPVPANYASKSKLVEGDVLKLTITSDGSFIYKQIGPAERKIILGVVSVDPDGNYFIAAEGKAYKVLLASITYFKVEPGDEVTLVIPKDIDSDWGSIENVLQKGHEHKTEIVPQKKLRNIDDLLNEKPVSFTTTSEKSDLVNETPAKEEATSEEPPTDDWASDLEELKRELEKDDTDKN